MSDAIDTIEVRQVQSPELVTEACPDPQDIFINGVAFRTYFPGDFISSKPTLFRSFGWDADAEAIGYLLSRRKSPMASGQYPVYVCELCADFDCGTLTAKISRTAKTVKWQDFCWEADYDEFPKRLFPDVGPFEFDREAYDNVFEPFMPRHLS